jgi:cysteine-rich repeat protein
VEEGEDCDDGNTEAGDCCGPDCLFEPPGASCDRLFCYEEETCNGAGFCGGGTARSCDDGVGCTLDQCDEFADACYHTPDDWVCRDASHCNGEEVCDPEAGCLPGEVVVCDDGDICTDDWCSEASDSCQYTHDESNDPSCAVAVCGDGLVQGEEECDDGNALGGDCCGSDCRFEGAGSPCDDGLYCGVQESCDGAGSCGDALPRDCDDGVACTLDSCSEYYDSCVHTPDDAPCDDGLHCNGAETCHATSGCLEGEPVDCDDADICTHDRCDEAQGACEHEFDETLDPTCLGPCPDGDGDGFADCQAGSCDPAGLSCGDCDDGDLLVHPEAEEDCGNGLDDDCDGAIDTLDEECVGCLDEDEDGYSPEGKACGPVDCDDADPAVNPGCREICDDGRDNDCDGLVDGADAECDVSSALTITKVLAPATVRVRPGVPEEHQVKVFVRNDGDRAVRVHVLLTSEPERGVSLVPVGREALRIAPRQQKKLVFAARFGLELTEAGEPVLVRFTAVAVDREGARSSPASPERDTVVEPWPHGEGYGSPDPGWSRDGAEGRRAPPEDGRGSASPAITR